MIVTLNKMSIFASLNRVAFVNVKLNSNILFTYLLEGNNNMRKYITNNFCFIH